VRRPETTFVPKNWVLSLQWLIRLGSIAEHRWGLVTTAQAEDAGVSRKQLSRMAASGAIKRVAQGVYRMAGAPPTVSVNRHAQPGGRTHR